MNADTQALELRLRGAFAAQMPEPGVPALDARMGALIQQRRATQGTGPRPHPWTRVAAAAVLGTAGIGAVILGIRAVSPLPGPTPHTAGIMASPSPAAAPTGAAAASTTPSTAVPAPTAPPTLAPAARPPAWEVEGEPAATVERDGLRMELFIAATELAPGDWLQARVRVTNLSDTTRYFDRQECLGDGIDIEPDLGGLLDPGVVQTGAAGRLKSELMAMGDMPSWPQAGESDSGITEQSGPRCVPQLVRRAGRLLPGKSQERDLEIRPVYLLDRALPSGSIAVRASFKDWGGGKQADRDLEPLVLESAVTVTGDGAGYPSPAQLVDIALADPQFRAYVEETEARGEWVNPSWHAWDRPPSAQARWKDLTGRVGDGFVEIGLFSVLDGKEAYAVVNIDPWSGEVLSFWED